MNQLTTYEIAIAEKVQQLPLPNMADSIWANIEQQLDMDLHTDDSSASNQATSKLPVKAIIVAGIITVIIVAVLLVVQFNKKHKRSSVPTQTPQPVQTIPDNGQVGPPPGAKQIIQPSGTIPFENKLPLKNDGSTNQLPKRNSGFPDSLFSLPVNTNSPLLPELKPGPSFSIQPAATDTNSVKPGPVKPRGVQGISSDDYKISAGKDSAKKGD